MVRAAAAILIMATVAACTDKTDGLGDAGPRDIGNVSMDSGPTPDAAVLDAPATDADRPDTGACLDDPSCAACVDNGGCCEFSVNCLAGSICNRSDDPLYDPQVPEQTCMQVVCQNDGDCRPGKVCGVNNICEDPICQNDDDCEDSRQCLGGECIFDPGMTATCQVVEATYGLMLGQRAFPQAIAYDAQGNVLAGASFSWRSSSLATVEPSPDGSVVARQPGMAVVEASSQSVQCTGSVTVDAINRELGMVIRVASKTTSIPLPAQVDVSVAGQVTSYIANDRGLIEIPQPTAPIDWITASVASIDTAVTLIQPQTQDTEILVPTDTLRFAGGIRGLVDVSSQTRRDVPLGLSGSGASNDLLNLGLSPTVTSEFFTASINAPDLGIVQDTDLPGGMIFGLGNQVFTQDKLRCGSLNPGPSNLGCLLYSVPEAAQTTWAIAGWARLSALTALSDELSQGDPNDPEVGARSVAAFVRVSRNLRHGATPYMRPAQRPRVPANSSIDCNSPSTPDYFDVCRPDHAAYEEASMTASHELKVRSVVGVPSLLDENGRCPSMITVTAAADLGIRGLTPLGFGVGVDTIDDVSVPDCQIDGEAKPFGEASTDLGINQIALAAAPRHSGLEKGRLFVIAVASTPGDPERARSITMTNVDRIGPSLNLVNPFMRIASADIVRSTGLAEVSAPGASGVRLELYGPNLRWIVHAPGEGTIDLSNITPLNARLNAVQRARVSGYLMGNQYHSQFALRSEVRLNPNVIFANITSRSCSVGASGCAIR